MSKKIIYAMPLSDINLNTYIKGQCGDAPIGEIRVTQEKELPIIPFLQNDWGDSNDCTIISISTILYQMYNHQKDFSQIYNIVVKYAKQYGYKDSSGTLPFFNKAIFEKSIKEFENKDVRVKTKYLKNIGFTYTDIVKLINSGTLFTLSLFKDGRGYYENHTVNIAGYKICTIGQKQMRFLIVYDNWSREKRYIDFDKLNTICCINYINGSY